MPKLRIVFLWHMHQPYYKDLVSGEYRLPWVRLHALKDYYGMVQLLEEFPQIHQTFNLVPSLIAQIEDYVAGTARDPFLDVAAKPARDLTAEERQFALQYLFQANQTNMIGRYPRYQELWEKFPPQDRDLERAAKQFQAQDFADLQVLSQLAWCDEFFLDDPELAALIRKGRGYSESDQQMLIRKQREFLAQVLPAYQAAAQRGGIEISASPFYHPILPLLCDTDLGRVSSPGLPLPQERFQHPEDAEEQLRRGLALHERVFGMRPRGIWPSEGSVSDEVLAIAYRLGFNWVATDEGVLSRSLGSSIRRDDAGRLAGGGAERLYTIYRYEKESAAVHMLFRDHTLSDLIGFVYAGMPAAQAAADFIQKIRDSAQPVLRAGKDAVVSIILDGENAWEYYPRSGREFLRRVYDAIQKAPDLEAVTVSEAIARHQDFGKLASLTPGSWINANFNVWIGSPEDNHAWDYLSAARNVYAEVAPAAPERQRVLAFEELLIAEGSDWNWWYGPEHHSANDRDFDELYRKHLSNVYQALGEAPPDSLAQPILTGVSRPYFVPQTAYIHPRIDGDLLGYFDWMGAAIYTADRRSSAMHGRRFLLDAAYAGIDEQNVYARLDFARGSREADLDLVLNLETVQPGAPEAHCRLRLDVSISSGAVAAWKLERQDGEGELASDAQPGGLEVRLRKVLELKVPLTQLQAAAGDNLRLCFSTWKGGLPTDSLPIEGCIELQVLSEAELAARS
ncbi:MAG TPA: glycoside hydrolase family 57 protein [Terriglobales bacterium]|nr:glycoside hydrolase family 57 protein [Terriglobales bacterium]